jgi:hypothetical protein
VHVNRCVISKRVFVHVGECSFEDVCLFYTLLEEPHTANDIGKQHGQELVLSDSLV